MKKTLLKIQYKLKNLRNTLPVEQHKEVEEIENLVVFLAGKIRMGELREESRASSNHCIAETLCIKERK